MLIVGMFTSSAKSSEGPDSLIESFGITWLNDICADG